MSTELPTFTHAQLASLEAFASAVQAKSAFGGIPSKLALGELEVPVRSVRPDEGATDPLGEEDLRALYHPLNKEILISCAGVQFSGGQVALEHILRVVGHEALHAIQATCFSEDEIEEASRLNKEAKRSSSPSDYANYIEHKVELPAHAVMIALELRRTLPKDFDQAAPDARSYRYFADRLNGAQAAEAILKNLVGVARDMHRNLQPTSSE